MDGRQQRAWALARRVGRRRSPDPRAIHWAILGSVWLHLGLFAIAPTGGRPAPAQATEPMLVVVRAAPEGVRTSAVEESTRAIASVRVVRTSPADASPVRPERWEAESRYDTVAPRLIRSLASELAGRPGEGDQDGRAAVPPSVARDVRPTPVLPSGARVAAPERRDPADELRIALGWGAIDRATLARRPAWAGTLLGQGRADGAPSSVLDAPIAWRTALSTRGTPLGAWVELAESLIGERWRALDLDTHARAVGIAGDVTIRYRVLADGTVEDEQLVRSSGDPHLDAMALRAIPARLPELPRELGGRAIHQELTLHYRNPLVTLTPR